MSEGQGFVLHLLAVQDMTDIWEFLAEANPQAARRVREDILGAICVLVSFPHQGHRRTDLTSRPIIWSIKTLIAPAPNWRGN
jgi:plasmid stabilization system protein ParE